MSQDLNIALAARLRERARSLRDLATVDEDRAILRRCEAAVLDHVARDIASGQVIHAEAALHAAAPGISFDPHYDPIEDLRKAWGLP